MKYLNTAKNNPTRAPNILWRLHRQQEESIQTKIQQQQLK